MVTTLSAENCKTKKIDTHTQKKFFLEKSIKVSFYHDKLLLYL